VSADRHEPIQITEHELRSMTTDVDEMHRATLPIMKEALAEWSELHQQIRTGVAKIAPSRRGFLMGAGVALGGLAAFQTTRLMGYLLYKVSPRDPSAFAAASVIVVVAALVACVVPAWRATHTDPIQALRG